MQDISVSTRRDQISIMIDLLTILQQPQKLTHILYKSNMSYSQLIKYLKDMKTMEMLIEQNIPHRCFTITSKGKKFLEMIEKKVESK